MSQAPTRKPDRTMSEKIDGRKVTTQLYTASRDWEAVIVIKRGNDQWTLGIDDEAVAHVEETTATVTNLDGEIDAPIWVEEVMLSMEIERVEA